MKFGFNKNDFEIGIYSLGDHLPNPHTGEYISAKQRIDEIIQLAIRADELGLDFFGLGESHQKYFASQSHAVILSAIAQATNNIKIGSASTIISTSDPVRVYENFSTLHSISDGRIELVAGRASRTGLFSLLGYNIAYYEELFDESFELLKTINENESFSWEGRFRPALADAEVYPRPEEELKIWRAVGGAPASAIEAGRQNVPMFLAHLLGSVDIYGKTIKAYRSSALVDGHNPDELPITTAGLLYVADTNEDALAEAYPHSNEGMKKINGQGFNKRSFYHGTDIDSVLNVGEADLIVEKIVRQNESFDNQRYIAQLDFGGITFDKQMEMLEILGTYIAPKAKEKIRENKLKGKR